jgi:hypothetical protein
MDSELVRTQKQSYLRSYVLEQGYSAEEFADFLAKEKEGGRIWFTTRPKY